MRRPLAVSAAALAVAFACLAATSPHDTWLLVAPGPARGDLTLSLRTGMDFPVSTNAVAAERVQGTLLEPSGARRALGDAATPWREQPDQKCTTCALGALAPGLYVAVADTQPRVLKLPAREFNEYLLSDGLPDVLAGRLAREEDDQDSVEQYRKCAKVVFAVGDGGAGRFDAVLGQALEIVPLDDPTQLRPRHTLRVRVLFEGKPVARALLGWDHPGNGHDVAGSARTDAAGEALVPIAQTGWMTLRLVHMLRPQTAEFEWQSYWASCSFEVRGG